MSRVQVRLNGRPVELAASSTVATLVTEHARDERRVAVAVNRDVVPRSAWPHTVLEDGDVVELLTAVAGG